VSPRAGKFRTTLPVTQILVEVFVANEGQLVDWQHNIKKIPEVASVAYSLFSAVYKQDFNWFSCRPISLAT
jgi:hypothetical protein